MKEQKLESKLEALILKAKELGIQFISGPATFETIYNTKIFHVLEDMTDETFEEALERKVGEFESKKFLSILNKHSLIQPIEKQIRDVSPAPLTLNTVSESEAINS
jgi:hypothetical protein